MSEHIVRRNLLPRLRRVLEEIPFKGYCDPNDHDRVIVEVEPEYDYLVTKSIRRDVAVVSEGG